MLERQVEDLYERIQLPETWVTRLREELQAEMITRSSRNATERTSLVSQLQRLENERRNLLDAYYAGAVDVVTLRREQERINREAQTLQERLSQVDASLDAWQAVLDIAIRFAAECAAAYRRALPTPFVGHDRGARPTAGSHGRAHTARAHCVLLPRARGPTRTVDERDRGGDVAGRRIHPGNGLPGLQRRPPGREQDRVPSRHRRCRGRARRSCW